MNKKYDVGTILTVEFAQKMYQRYGIAHIVTDGKCVQIEKEPIADQNE